MPWQEVITFLGGATAITVLLGYLGKQAIEAYLSGRLESHRAELERITAEHSVRFQKLHADRAEAIKELYTLIVEIDDSLGFMLRYLDESVDVEQTARRLMDQFTELGKCRRRSRIFFTESVWLGS